MSKKLIAKDAIAITFEVEKEVDIFWQDDVHFMVGKVKGGPHDSCGSTHGSAKKLVGRRVLRTQTDCFS